VPDALKHVVKTALDRLCGDDDGRLQSGEFAGAARQLAVVGLPRQKVAFFKYLVIVGIGVGAITMRLDGLAIDQPRQLTTAGHLVQDRIGLIVGRRHDQIDLHILLAVADLHRLRSRYSRLLYR